MKRLKCLTNYILDIVGFNIVNLLIVSFEGFIEEEDFVEVVLHIMEQLHMK
jgi:hypothetical protein